MKFSLIAASILLVLTPAAFAAHQQNKPEKCPELSAIHFSEADVKGPNQVFGYYIDVSDSFGTKEAWEFFIMGLHEKSRHEAYQQAKKSLQSAKYLYGPRRGFEGNDDIYACEYSNKENLIMAITRDYPEHA